MPGKKGEPMKHKHFNRLLSMLLVVATLFGLLAVPASAATLGDSGKPEMEIEIFKSNWKGISWFLKSCAET